MILHSDNPAINTNTNNLREIDLNGQKQFVFHENYPTRWKINFSFLCKCFYTKINLALNIQWWTFMGK